MPVPRDLVLPAEPVSVLWQRVNFRRRMKRWSRSSGLRIPDMCVFTMQMRNKIISDVR